MPSHSVEDVSISVYRQHQPSLAVSPTIQLELVLSNVLQLLTISLIILLADVYFIVLEHSMAHLLLLIIPPEDVLMYVLLLLTYLETYLH
jgi:hypothetical protein